MINVRKISFFYQKYFILIIFFCIIVFGSFAQAQSAIKEFLYVTVDESPNIYLLYVMANGVIYDSFRQITSAYGSPGKMVITPDRRHVYIGSYYYGAIEGFQKDSTTGNLYLIDTTPYNGESQDITITLNGDYLLASQALFRIDSTGVLFDTGSRYTTGGWYDNVMRGINPRGNPLITEDGFGNLRIYNLNYDSAVLTHTTTININLSGNVKKIAFTPDGSLALVASYFYSPPTYDVVALHCDTTGAVTTTGQRWDLGITATDVAITPDGKFGFVAVDENIVTLAIDTITGIITDTGKRFHPFTGFVQVYIRLTEDGQMAVIGGSGSNIITANISAEGDLTWTGYSFPFGTTYGAIIDMELVPAAQVTSVNINQWQLYE